MEEQVLPLRKTILEMLMIANASAHLCQASRDPRGGVPIGAINLGGRVVANSSGPNSITCFPTSLADRNSSIDLAPMETLMIMIFPKM
ncbi:hypothetical protein GOP47_0012213 [Adiantum capillus-veneris]|uniref:Uncharacterized protein n=1 Tax=Adiantum capillus-veneris TaxID=13818 RepID=A0A9D4UQS1_ADICA|nr:hypothetical protein GOP47_0012213 [Adiantum capillus-veneris]